MSVNGGPNISENGLIFSLDAADRTSYPGTGTAWNDLVGNNNGTLTNGPTFNSGNKGSIVFDGVNDYIDCGNGPAFQITTSITTETWVKLTALNNSLDLNLLSKYSNSGGSENQGWILFKSTGNYTSFGPNNTGPNNNEFSWLATSNGNFQGAVIGTGEQVLTNTWYQVVGIFNSTNNSMSIYVNGVLKRSAIRTGQTSGVLLNAPRNVCIGATPDDNNRYLQGSIPLTRIYNRALTDTEVLQNYNNTKSRFGL
jgi:hypothetical protein